MAKFHKLTAAKGTDEANFEGTSYPVGDDGTVSVPQEAVDSLVSLGGFTAEDHRDPTPVGNVRMTHALASGCSWGGAEFHPDEDGVFVVPAGASADLAAHGFEMAPPEHAKPKPSGAPPQLKLPK
jgi:hypothetical protein